MEDNASTSMSSGRYCMFATGAIVAMMVALAGAKHILHAGLSVDLSIAGACLLLLSLLEIRYRKASQVLTLAAIALFGALVVVQIAISWSSGETPVAIMAFVTYALAVALVLLQAEDGRSPYLRLLDCIGRINTLVVGCRARLSVAVLPRRSNHGQ